MEFAELPGSSPCLNPKQHSEQCISFNQCPVDLNSRLQSRAHRERTHVLLPRYFLPVFLQVQIHNNVPGLLHRFTTCVQNLGCTTFAAMCNKSKMTFFNARRKNGEILAVDIVRKILRFQTKELKKYARFKQSLHI